MSEPMTAGSPSARGSLLAVVSAKGGCGATLVATHLAVHQAGSGSVCLADFDFDRGDVARALDLEARDCFQPLLERLSSIDAELLESLLPRHDSGVHALTQPYDLSSIVRFDGADFAALLAGLRRHYDLVVADCGAAADQNTLTTLMAAERIVLVSQPTVPALRGTQRMLALLDRVMVPLERVRLVINDREPQDMSAQDIHAFLEFEVAAVLPRDRTACRIVDTTGRLLAQAAPRSPLTAAMDRLCATVTGRAEAPIAATGLARLWSWGRG